MAHTRRSTVDVGAHLRSYGGLVRIMVSGVRDVQVPPVGGPTDTTANITIVVFVAGLIADRIAGGRTPWRPARSDRGTFWIIQIGQLVALYVGLDLPRWTSSGTLSPLVWPIGIAIMIAGIGLRIWSVRTLGAWFDRDIQVRTGQTLVTGGPYRWLRHPSYAGVLMLFTGLGVAQANVYSIAVLAVVPTLVYLRRINVEEAAMEKAFGASYREFAAHRKRLIPGVY